jgi:phage shock protein A
MSKDPFATIVRAIERLEEGQDKLRIDVMARIDRLQDAVTSAQRANDNTREEVSALREQVMIMWRQVKLLEAQVRQIKGEP